MLALVNTPRLNEESPDQLRPGLKTAQLDAARAKPPQYGQFAKTLGFCLEAPRASRPISPNCTNFLAALSKMRFV